MATMFDVSQQKLVDITAEELKKIKEIQPASWAAFVKTGSHKERVPSQEDWWYQRAASILRVIAQRGPIGVSKLRTRYGGKKDRGVKPERFGVASGNIIRKILQQLDKAGLSKQAEIGVHKGRVVTPAGQKLLDKCANSIEKPKKQTEAPAKEKPEEKKPEEKKPEDKPAPAEEPKAEKPKPAKEKPEKKPEAPKEEVPAEENEPKNE